jgi:hypothetical protein
MRGPAPFEVDFIRNAFASLLCASALAACAEQSPVETVYDPPVRYSATAIQALDCTGNIGGSVNCVPASGRAGGASPVLIGGQNTFLRLTSSNVNYSSDSEIFKFDVTVQNLMNEAIGTPDGVVPDPDGIQVFFATGPTATGGTGTVTVANADGTGTFTGSNQPYFAYPEILPMNAVSSARNWQLNVPATVTTFAFTVYIETDVQYLLVINELLANPGGTISDANGEWFEIYNAGTRNVNLQNLVIADSAASGRRPYHLVNSSVLVTPGGYTVLGNTTNTTNNGGVPVDYAYGSALVFANSLDALKISRVYGADTLTIDRAAYASAATSAQNGISRELLDPTSDNSNMDGGNWGDAGVLAVYGPGGRGTPGMPNSVSGP